MSIKKEYFLIHIELWGDDYFHYFRTIKNNVISDKFLTQRRDKTLTKDEIEKELRKYYGTESKKIKYEIQYIV